MLGQERAGEAMQAFAPSLAIVPAIRAGFNPDHRGPLEKQIVLFHSNRAREAKLSGNFSVSSPISVYQPAFLCQSVAHRQVRTVVSALSHSPGGKGGQGGCGKFLMRFGARLRIE